jgi:DNA-directed RNA polymerase subunit alpha
MTRIALNTLAGRNEELQQRLEMSTAEIGLSVRTTNCLEEKGISNFGQKTLEEVYKALEGIGFYRQHRKPELALVN